MKASGRYASMKTQLYTVTQTFCDRSAQVREKHR